MSPSLFRRGLLLATAALFAVTAGCGKKDAAPASPGAANPASASGSATSGSTSSASSTNAHSGAPKIIRVGNGAEPEDLDPQVVTGVGEHKIITALMEGLITYSKTGDIAPGVAESWEISADGLTYTFHLRPTARWSNGDTLTATDFVRSYQRMLTPSLGAQYAYQLFHLVGAEEFNTGKTKDFSTVGVTALDEHTLRLTLKHPTPFLLEAMQHYAWFPVHIPTLEKFGGLDRKGSPWTRAGNYVGNGPFNLTEWQPGQKIRVTRSETYWDKDNVKLDGIEFYGIDKSDVEERLYRTGKLDYLYGMPLGKIATYKRDHKDAFHQDPFYGVYFYRLNVTKKPLDDKRVRRALALAIDRDSIIKNILRDGGQKPAYNFTPPSDKYVSTARITGDLAEAKRLLVEAGYPGGQGMPSVQILFNTDDSHRVIAEAIQQMWRQNLGIDATLSNQEWKVYLNAQQTKSYQALRAAWIADFKDPHTFIDMWITDGGNNNTGWSNAEYDRLLRGALSSKTEADRMEVYNKLEAILADEVPVIPIYFYTRIYALNPKVKNWVPTDLDNRGWKWIELAD